MIEYIVAKEGNPAAWVKKIFTNEKLMREIIAGREVAIWLSQVVAQFNDPSGEFAASGLIKYNETLLIADWNREDVDKLHKAFNDVTHARQELTRLEHANLTATDAIIAYTVSALSLEVLPPLARFIDNLIAEENLRRETVAKAIVSGWVKQVLRYHKSDPKGWPRVQFDDELLANVWSQEKIRRAHEIFTYAHNTILQFKRLDDPNIKSTIHSKKAMTDYIFSELNSPPVSVVSSVNYVDAIIEEQKKLRAEQIQKEIAKRVTAYMTYYQLRQGAQDSVSQHQVRQDTISDAHAPEKLFELIQLLDDTNGRAELKTLLVNHVLTSGEDFGFSVIDKIFSDENSMREMLTRLEIAKWVDALLSNYQQNVSGVPVNQLSLLYKGDVLTTIWGKDKSQKFFAAMHAVWREIPQFLKFDKPNQVGASRGAKEVMTDYLMSAMHAEAMPSIAQFVDTVAAGEKKPKSGNKNTRTHSRIY